MSEEEKKIEIEEVDLDAVETKPDALPNDAWWWNGGDDEDFPHLEKEKGYEVLAVWPSMVAQTDDADAIQEYFSNMGCKNPVKIIGCVQTLPDYGDRHLDEPLTGGRVDLCFYFHNEDIYRVAVRRLTVGIRWWEDVVGNDVKHAQDEGVDYETYSIYPKDFRDWAEPQPEDLDLRAWLGEEE